VLWREWSPYQRAMRRCSLIFGAVALLVFSLFPSVAAALILVLPTRGHTRVKPDLVLPFYASSHDPGRTRHAQPHSGLPAVGGAGPAKVSRHHQALSDSARTDTRPAERDGGGQDRKSGV